MTWRLRNYNETRGGALWSQLHRPLLLAISPVGTNLHQCASEAAPVVCVSHRQLRKDTNITSISLSISQSVYQSVNQSFNQSICQSVNQCDRLLLIRKNKPFIACWDLNLMLNSHIRTRKWKNGPTAVFLWSILLIFNRKHTREFFYFNIFEFYFLAAAAAALTDHPRCLCSL